MAKSKRITAVSFASGEVYEYRAMWDDQITSGGCTAHYGEEGEAMLHERRRQELLKVIAVKSSIRLVDVYRSRSGGVVHFRAFIASTYSDGKPRILEITHAIADLVGHKVSSSSGGIVMSGYGYSKSFQIVYGLGLSLWPNGTPEPHGTRNGEPDSNGGYALSVA